MLCNYAIDSCCLDHNIPGFVIRRPVVTHCIAGVVDIRVQLPPASSNHLSQHAQLQQGKQPVMLF